MKKIIDMGKVSATGSFQLFLGIVVSTVVMTIGTMILGWIMDPAEYGAYTIALTPSLMFGLFRDWGVDAALTRYIANYRSTNGDDAENICNVLLSGVIFEIVSGLVLSILSFLLSNFIATTFFHRPELTPLIAIASVTVFFGALLKASFAAYSGFERMDLYSYVTVFQGFVKSAFSPLLVFLGLGALGAVLGYTVAFVTAGLLSVVLLFVIYRNLRKNTNCCPPARNKIIPTLRMILKYSFPLSISSLLDGFRVQLFGFIMASLFSDAIVGNYQIAANFAVALTFFTFPISTVLFPAFSKIDSKKERPILVGIFTSSVKYTTLFVVPATLLMMVLSKQMIFTLFSDKWVHAPLFLVFYILATLLSGIGSISLGGFLSGVGETKLLMIMQVIRLAITLPLVLLLSPILGLPGIFLGDFIAAIPVVLLGLQRISSRYGAKVDLIFSAKIFFVSVIAAVPSYFVVNLLNLANWIMLLLGLFVFVTIFVICISIIGALDKSEINNLKTIFANLGFISKIINFVLEVLEKLTFLRLQKNKLST